MVLYSVCMLKWREGQVPIYVAGAYDVSTFGFFQRGGARELCKFVSREVTQRAKPGDRMSVEHKQHLCHIIVRRDNLACAVVSTHDYPQRVAFSFIQKALEGFNNIHGAQWEGAVNDIDLPVPQLEALIRRYQNPDEADPMLKIQRDLEDTKEIIVRTMDDLLERGEKLENVMDRSSDLSLQSKTFLKNTNDLNSCCMIL